MMHSRGITNPQAVMLKSHQDSFFMTGRGEFRPMCFLFGQKPTVKVNDIITDVEILQLCVSRDHVMAEVIKKSDHQNIVNVPSEVPINDNLIMRHTHPKSFFMFGRSEFRPMTSLLDEKQILVDRGEEIPIVVLQICISREYCLAEVVTRSDYCEANTLDSSKGSEGDSELFREEELPKKGVSIASNLRKAFLH